VGLTNLGSELEKCVGSRVHLVVVSIFFEKNFYRLPFTPPSSSPYRSFTTSASRRFPRTRTWSSSSSAAPSPTSSSETSSTGGADVGPSTSPSTYRLQWANDQGGPNVWNIEQLCRFYPQKIYIKIKLCTLPLCNFNIIKREIPCSTTPLSTCFLVSPFFTLSSFPFPLEELGGLV
jgi:hypothetical protein